VTICGTLRARAACTEELLLSTPPLLLPLTDELDDGPTRHALIDSSPPRKKKRKTFRLKESHQISTHARARARARAHTRFLSPSRASSSSALTDRARQRDARTSECAARGSGRILRLHERSRGGRQRISAKAEDVQRLSGRKEALSSGRGKASRRRIFGDRRTRPTVHRRTSSSTCSWTHLPVFVCRRIV
jgi:hypothetical protein